MRNCHSLLSSLHSGKLSNLKKPSEAILTHRNLLPWGKLMFPECFSVLQLFCSIFASSCSELCTKFCLKCLFVSCLSGIKNYSAVLGLALRIVSEEGIYNLENLQKKDWIHCGDQNACTYVLTQKSQTLIWTCPKRKGWIFVGITGPKSFCHIRAKAVFVFHFIHPQCLNFQSPDNFT